MEPLPKWHNTVRPVAAVNVYSDFLEEDKDLHIDRGLQNLGNTCFLNVITQALLHSFKFTSWLKNDSYHFKKCSCSECFTCSLGRCLRSTLKLKDGMSYSSSDLCDLLSRLGLEWGKQQDSYEFLVLLLAKLKEEYLSRFPEFEGVLDYVSQNTTPIDKIFGAWIETSVVCTKGCVSNTFSIVEQLQIPIASSIQEGINKYFESCELDLKCSVCENLTKCQRKVEFYQSPNVMILVLRRFDNNMQKVGRRVKTDETVIVGNDKYILYAVVIHQGTTPKNGHYIIKCRCPPNSWTNFSDETVEVCSSSSLNSAPTEKNSYILFYEKVTDKLETPSKNMKNSFQFGVYSPLHNAQPFIVSPMPKRTSSLHSACMGAKQFIPPIKIKKSKRLLPKTHSSQSSNDYKILKETSNLKRPGNEKPTSLLREPALPPIYIKRTVRDLPKTTSSQSSHDYQIVKDCDDAQKLMDSPFKPEVHSTQIQTHVRRITFDSPAKPPSKDINLSVGDVPGAALPHKDVEQNHVRELKRFLQCRGLPTGGIKNDLVARVKAYQDVYDKDIINPAVDDGIWYDKKKGANQCFSQQVSEFPTHGWGTFPSCSIPQTFNFGRIYDYLEESAPRYNSLPDDYESGDSDCLDDLVLEMSVQDNNLRHHWKIINDDERDEFIDPFDDEKGFINDVKRLRQGFRFLKSKHARNVRDVVEGAVYFVQCDMKASMEVKFYNVQIAISSASGNVKFCKCQCKAQTSMRCGHISGLLLYVWCHVRLNGHGAFVTRPVSAVSNHHVKPLSKLPYYNVSHSCDKSENR